MLTHKHYTHAPPHTTVAGIPHAPGLPEVYNHPRCNIVTYTVIDSPHSAEKPARARIIWGYAPKVCDSGGDMTEMQSEAEHLRSCTQTAAEYDWLVDRVAGMTTSWFEHLAWQDDTEFAKLMRQRENTGRPLGDTDFVKLMGKLLSRALLPKKPGPKGPRLKAKTNN